MARDKKHRLATDAGDAHWTTPFAALAVEGRDASPEEIKSPPAAAKAPKERLLLRRETAHRGGKTVLVLEGFSPAWSRARLEELLHDLKSALGCGGKLHERRLEIQGEQADRLQPLLENQGFHVKRGW